MNHVQSRIIENGIVAIARGIPIEYIVPMANALYAGGVRLLEITFDQSNANHLIDTPAAIAAVREQMGDSMSIGAGTVLTPQQARVAVAAGAEFLLSAVVNRDVIETAKELEAVMVPGATSPTEIYEALALGADMVKLFPAGTLGVDYLKAVRAPMPHIPIMAVGNIDENNTASFLKAGAVAVGAGGRLMNLTWAKGGQYQKLTNLASAYIAAVKEGRRE